MTDAPERPRLQFASAEEVVAALRAAGHRVTSAGRTVLDALLIAGEEPVTAQAIADGLGGRVPPSDPASVYRNLERLEALGVVRHVHVGHGAGVYVLDRGDAEYLVCERCGAVARVAPERLEPAREAIAAATGGFRARFAHFPLHGLCAGCGAREDEAAPAAGGTAAAGGAGGAARGGTRGGAP